MANTILRRVENYLIDNIISGSYPVSASFFGTQENDDKDKEFDYEVVVNCSDASELSPNLHVWNVTAKVNVFEEPQIAVKSTTSNLASAIYTNILNLATGSYGNSEVLIISIIPKSHDQGISGDYFVNSYNFEVIASNKT